MTDPSDVANTSPPGWHAESDHSAIARASSTHTGEQPTMRVPEFTPDNPQPPRGRAGPATHKVMDAAKARAEAPASPAKEDVAAPREENVRCTLSSCSI